MKRILVLDAHTNQALAAVRTLGRHGYHVMVASHRPGPIAGWSRFARGGFRLRREDLHEYGRLLTWAHGQGVNAVLPMTERACVLLNANRATWEDRGIVVGCAPPEILGAAFDKGRSVELALCAGLRVPPTLAPRSLEECEYLPGDIGFPCVVKPRFSNAWNGSSFLHDSGCAYVSDRKDLARTVAAKAQWETLPLVQGYVPGQGKGVFALCDRGRVLAWFAHERLRDVRPTGSGSSLRRSAPLDPRLTRPAERILAAARWHGPAMVEFRDDGGAEPYFMEINGRFWNSLQLAITAGVDFPLLWTRVLLGERVEPVRGYATGITMRWLWGDVRRFVHILAGRPRGYSGTFPSRTDGARELFGPQPPGTVPEILDWRDPLPAAGEVWRAFADGVLRR
jgi:hypothetical protein